MKFIKISKFAKLAIISTLLTGGILGATIPFIVQTTSVQNTTTNTNDDKKIKTGKITHGSDTQVVSSVNDIVIDEISKNSAARKAIVSKNGVQELYVWGSNNNGQLGLGDTSFVPFPVKFDLTQFGTYDGIEFNYSNTSDSSYAIVTQKIGDKDTQRLYTWGLNGHGQLGLGTTSNVTTPTLVDTASLGGYDSIDSIYNEANIFFIITKKSGLKQLYVAGRNDFGSLGDGSTSNNSTFKPIPNTSLGSYTDILNFSHTSLSIGIVVDTATGPQFYVWGRNDLGQLGLGTTTNMARPTLHTNTTLFNSARLPSLEISISDSSYAWDKAQNQIFSWGLNQVGQLGIRTTTNQPTPTQIQSSSLNNGKISKVNIGASVSSSIVVEVGGQLSVFVCGSNNFGQLGLNNTTNVAVPTAFTMANIGNPTMIRDFNLPNSGSSYALVEIGNRLAYYVWGNNATGQLGIGNTTNQSKPQQMTIPQNTTLVNAWLLNGMSSMVVNNNGVLENYVCGNNSSGQLGLGDTVNRSTMVQVLQPNASTEFILNDNASYDISATDAFNQMYFIGGIIDKKLLSRYMNIIRAPSKMELKLVGNPDIDFINGILNITIAPTIVVPPLSTEIVTYNRPLTFSISGFRKVTPVNSRPVTVYNTVPGNLNANQLYSAVTNEAGIVTNYGLLSQYIDLTSIPSDSVIKLIRIPNVDEYKLDFTFFSNKFYNDRGASTVERDPITGLLVDYKTNININIISSNLNLGLIIGLSVGGAAFLFILIIIIVKSVAKYKAVKSYGEYLE